MKRIIKSASESRSESQSTSQRDSKSARHSKGRRRSESASECASVRISEDMRGAIVFQTQREKCCVCTHPARAHMRGAKKLLQCGRPSRLHLRTT